MHSNLARPLAGLLVAALLAGPAWAAAPPPDAERARMFAHDAAQSLAYGNLVEAEASLRAAWDVGAEPALLLGVADERLAAGDLPQALRVCELTWQLSQAPAVLDHLEAMAQEAADAQRLEDAVRVLRLAWPLSGEPRHLANLGRLQQIRGHLASAADYLDRFLREAPAHERAPVVQQLLPIVEQRLAATHRRVAVTSTPPGAEVTLAEAGEPRQPGDTPLELWLAHGDVRLRLRLPAHHDLEQVVTVTADSPDAVHAELEPLAEPDPEPEPEPEPEPPPAPEPAPPGADFAIPVATWVTGGLALTSAAVGAALGGIAIERAAAAKAYGANPANDPKEWDRKVAEVEALGLGSSVALGVAAASAVTAVVLAFVLQDDDDASTALTIAPAPTPNGGTLLLGGRF